MSKDQKLKEAMGQYLAGVSFMLDDNDEVSMIKYGGDRGVIEAIVSSATANNEEQNELTKTILFSSVIGLMVVNKDDMQKFFSMLNQAILGDGNDNKPKYVQLKPIQK